MAPSAIVPIDMHEAPAGSRNIRPAAPSSPEGCKLQLQEAFLAQYSPDDGQVTFQAVCIIRWVTVPCSTMGAHVAHVGHLPYGL